MSPVYRIGGDEFVAILEGADYDAQDALLADFDRQMEENLTQGKVVVSAGVSRFMPGQDDSFRAVFERADERMYQRKRALKGTVGR